MSLVDPQEAARRDHARHRGTASALIATICFGVLALAAATVLGFAVGGVFEQLRVMSINSVFGSWETETPIAFRAWGLPLGILGLIVTLGLYGTWNHRYSGRSDFFVIVGPLTIVLAGLTVGTWLASTMWAAPDAVGVAVDPVFGQNETWGIGAWALYAGTWWLPGLFALLTVLSLIGRVLAARRRERNGRVVEQLLARGVRTEAEITQAPLPEPSASRMIAPLVARFSDSEGVSRWVACTAALRTRDVPAVGARRPLVFDPADPGDVQRIFLSPAGGTDPSSFEPVRAAQ
ncbi:hypothetical protein [Leucobacter chromiiresistens]|uniref:hypothetical protein n=1 Tax=Leucobacter chromiiresistens TaxID=1079994 RepID=UPI0004975B02|nr:hypothetical protein [Leucobacter chromiiresistens]